MTAFDAISVDSVSVEISGEAPVVVRLTVDGQTIETDLDGLASLETAASVAMLRLYEIADGGEGP